MDLLIGSVACGGGRAPHQALVFRELGSQLAPGGAEEDHGTWAVASWESPVVFC